MIAVVASLALAVGPASAHAELDTATPVPNQVTTSLDELVLLFFGGISQVSVVLTDPTGAAVDLGAAELRGPSEARIPVVGGELPGGVYRVDWAVISADDAFPANGAFTFTYEPGSSRPLGQTLAFFLVPLALVGGVLWWLRKPAKRPAGRAAKPSARAR